MNLPWESVGQQFYTLQLLINCRKRWWPTNLMNHPRAKVPPLLFALGNCCPWGVFSLHVTLSPLVPWFGAAEQWIPWSSPLDQGWLGQHSSFGAPRGRVNVLSPEQGSEDLSQWWNSSKSKNMGKLGPNDIGDQTESGLKQTLEHFILLLWGPQFVGTWFWICSFHSFHAVWLM